MTRYIKHLRVIIHHKYWVFRASMWLKVPILIALFHDMSKFSPQEFPAFAKNFYNEDGSPIKVRGNDGGYDPNAQPNGFSKAWLHHQRNKHHWQAWVSIGDKGNLHAIKIPDKYVREMVADWVGAGIAYSGKSDPSGWYNGQKDNMILHPETRLRIEQLVQNPNLIRSF